MVRASLTSGISRVGDSATERRGRGSPCCMGVTAVSSVVRFAGSTAADGWPGAGVVNASAAGGAGSQAPLLLLLLPPSEPRSWAPLLLGGQSRVCHHPCCCCRWWWFSGAAGSAATAGGLGLLEPPPCPFSSVSSTCPSTPASRCTDVWNTLDAWCIGQRHLCCVVDVLLVVD